MSSVWDPLSRGPGICIFSGLQAPFILVSWDSFPHFSRGFNPLFEEPPFPHGAPFLCVNPPHFISWVWVSSAPWTWGHRMSTCVGPPFMFVTNTGGFLGVISLPPLGRLCFHTFGTLFLLPGKKKTLDLALCWEHGPLKQPLEDVVHRAYSHRGPMAKKSGLLHLRPNWGAP